MIGTGEKIGGVPIDVLHDIAESASGSVQDGGFISIPLKSKKGRGVFKKNGGQTRWVIDARCLGVSETPSRRVITTKNRPPSLQAALRELDETAERVKQEQG